MEIQEGPDALLLDRAARVRRPRGLALAEALLARPGVVLSKAELLAIPGYDGRVRKLRSDVNALAVMFANTTAWRRVIRARDGGYVLLVDDEERRTAPGGRVVVALSTETVWVGGMELQMGGRSVQVLHALVDRPVRPEQLKLTEKQFDSLADLAIRDLRGRGVVVRLLRDAGSRRLEWG